MGTFIRKISCWCHSNHYSNLRESLVYKHISHWRAALRSCLSQPVTCTFIYVKYQPTDRHNYWVCITQRISYIPVWILKWQFVFIQPVVSLTGLALWSGYMCRMTGAEVPPCSGWSGGYLRSNHRDSIHLSGCIFKLSLPSSSRGVQRASPTAAIKPAVNSCCGGSRTPRYSPDLRCTQLECMPGQRVRPTATPGQIGQVTQRGL